MSSDRWRKIEEVFQRAADLPRHQRASFLDEACRNDPELRADVESLLSYDAEPVDHLHSAIRRTAASVAEAPIHGARGERIGPYELIRPIGRGGMGSVYLAVRADDTFRKQVALKVVKRGMDTDFVLSRFRHERQILAALEHPNIARLLDGGATNDGLPYFVMEYVEGKPITEFCKTHRLNIVDRLRLFGHVCSAVMAAHQNLVVHRDLKPGNILVNAAGTPKLLDFGIAKMLDNQLSSSIITQTVTGVRLLTPNYASPEQIRGEPITTATDIYSLGVLLYELIAGRPPYQTHGATPAEIQRVVCDVDPPPPSEMAPHLRRQLRGDLDNIVLMAMRKEPSRRYAAVQQLADDVRRHLDGLPISARKDTLAYRTSKFVTRHRVIVLAGVLVFCSLVGGIAATAYQASVSTRRFEQGRKLAHAFLFDFHDSIANLPGATKARELLVKRGLEYLDGLSAEAKGDTTLQFELARAYERVGDVQGDPMGGSPGDSAGALNSYKRALAILEDVSPRTDDIRKAMVDVYSKLGAVERNTGATTAGLESYRKAQAVAEELLATSPSRHELRRLAGVFTQSTRTLAAMGDLEGSLASTNRALSILNRLNESGATADDEVLHELALAYTSLSIQLPRVGRLKDGLENARKAVQIREALVQRQPNDLRFLRNLMIAWQHLGDTFGGPNQPNMGDHKAAIRAYQKMLGVASSLKTRDPGDRRLDQDLALAMQRLGAAQSADGRLPEGLDNLKRALEMETAAMESDHRNVFLKRNTALTLTQIASIEEKLGDHVAALSHCGRAVEINQALIRQDPGDREAQAEFLDSARTYSLMAARSGNRQTAMEFASQLEPVSRQLAKGSSDWTQLVQPAISQAYLGDIQTALGDRAGATRYYKESSQTFQKLKAAGHLDPFYAPISTRVVSGGGQSR